MNADETPDAAYLLQLRPEGPAVNSPERQLSLQDTVDTVGRRRFQQIFGADRLVRRSGPKGRQSIGPTVRSG
jgi:hypothetical protein